MNNRLYVGNLSWATTEESLKEAFEGYGPVESVSIITDRETGRSRGFGFGTKITMVELSMPTERRKRRTIH